MVFGLGVFAHVLGLGVSTQVSSVSILVSTVPIKALSNPKESFGDSLLYGILPQLCLKSGWPYNEGQGDVLSTVMTRVEYTNTNHLLAYPKKSPVSI